MSRRYYSAELIKKKDCLTIQQDRYMQLEHTLIEGVRNCFFFSYSEMT